MKRVLTFLALMLLPLSVMAMTPVSDSTLSDVTGQAGVNINADVQMNITMNTVAWGDSSGVDAQWNGSTGIANNFAWNTTAAGGYVGLNNFNIQNLRIRARTAAADNYNNYALSHLKPITIDVATGTGTADGEHGNGVTFVRLGLGALQITMNAMSLEAGLGAYSDTPALNQVLGSINLGNMGVYINPGSYVDIYNANGPNGAQGVNIFMNVIVDRFELGYVSWGDKDGIQNVDTSINGGSGITPVQWMADNNAGFVGLANLSIGAPITINGSVRIDVNTSYAGGYSHYNLLGTPYATAYSPVSVVHIAFDDSFTVKTGAITAKVALAAVPGLSSTSIGQTLPNGNPVTTPCPVGILGDIYISTFNLQIADGSWVDIWAH